MTRISYFLSLRKFLCLGGPLLCLEDKTIKQVQPEFNPAARTPDSNGSCSFWLAFLFCCFRPKAVYSLNFICVVQTRREHNGRCRIIEKGAEKDFQLVTTYNLFWLCNCSPSDCQPGVHDSATHIQATQSLLLTCICGVRHE